MFTSAITLRDNLYDTDQKGLQFESHNTIQCTMMYGRGASCPQIHHVNDCAQSSR